MYKSWKYLTVRSEMELRDPARLKKLLSARGNELNGVIGFGLASVISFGLSIFLFWVAYTAPMNKIEPAIGAIVVLLLAMIFLFFARMFLKEMQLNPVRQFLKEPAGLEFIKGEITAAHYQSSNGKRGKMIAEIKGKNSEGKEVLAIEFFDPSAWPFTTREADESLQEGDDWYDMKGKRGYLPVPVYILSGKESASALVGIDQSVLTI